MKEMVLNGKLFFLQENLILVYLIGLEWRCSFKAFKIWEKFQNNLFPLILGQYLFSNKLKYLDEMSDNFDSYRSFLYSQQVLPKLSRMIIYKFTENHTWVII